MNALGAAAGLGLGLGLLTVASAVRAARPSLSARVAPYVTVRAPARSTDEVIPALLRPVVADATRVLDHLGSSTASVRRRLDLLGARTSTDSFRLEQVLWSSAALAGALVLALVLAATRGVAVVPLVVLVLVAGGAGALARDRMLTRQVEERRRRIALELPTVAELLALAVGAGEAPPAALDRVARTTHGELAVELHRTLADVRAGTTMSDALDALARRVDLPALARFADGIAVALERGSPLAEVLRAQAGDARDAAARDLLEEGGKREIAMLVPVVFFILPLTVLFALFPGLALLQGFQ